MNAGVTWIYSKQEQKRLSFEFGANHMRMKMSTRIGEE